MLTIDVGQKSTLKLMFRTVLLLSLVVGIAVALPNPPPASAHPLNNGYTTLTLSFDTIGCELFIPEPSLLKYDSDHDGHLTMEELSGQREAIADYLRNGIRLQTDSGNLAFKMEKMEMTDRETIPGVLFQLTFSSERPVNAFTLYYNLLFEDIDPLHVSFLTILDGKDVDQDVLDKSARAFHYESRHPQSALTVMWRYGKLGIEHILTGYDHLLFVLGLILIAARVRQALGIVTAFTIAHSVTLFLAATGRISLPAPWIEAAIALTIAYVAVENMIVRKSRLRWALTFAFGLVHGMGFAGALAETGLPKAYFMRSLLAFNVGVEAGQLAVVLAVLPLLLRIRRKPWYGKLVVVLSAVILAIALWWFAERIGVMRG